MKKLISLVAVVLMLSSFVTSNSNSIDFIKPNKEIVIEFSTTFPDIKNEEIRIVNSKKERTIDEICFSMASQAADNWMRQTGGSWSDSVPVFNEVQSACINTMQTFVLIAGYL